MSNKRQHSESGRHRNERKHHDQLERQHEQKTEMAWHENKTLRYGMVVLAVVAIVGMTGMFVAGMIQW